MKKVLIIGYSPRIIAPYLSYYIDLLRENSIPFDYLTRECIDSVKDTDIESNQIVYEYSQPKNKLEKIINVLRYRKFVKKQLKKYDFLICLTAYTAVIMSDVLIRQFNRRFIIDIRDYHPFLELSFVRKRFCGAVNSSVGVLVSSEGFKEWMPPKDSIVPIHNLPYTNNATYFRVMRQHHFVDRKNIAYLGVISYYPQNRLLIKALGNNPKYLLSYHGIYTEPGVLENYCRDNMINNVKFYGSFDNKEKHRLYEEVDLINSVYGNDSLVVTTALPNKLYDSALYGVPIMVSNRTYLSKIVEKYNLGFALDIDGDISKQLEAFWAKFDYNTFLKSAEQFINKCIKENDIAKKFIIDAYVSRGE